MDDGNERNPRIAYLYSRYPVFSQTFCDSEMLALERRGVALTIGSVNAPQKMFRHERFAELQAEVVYPAPSPVVKARYAHAEEPDDASWQRVAALVGEHDRKYGSEFKASTRARNGVFFSQEFARRGVEHVHIHFANRATHSALFMKAYGGIPFSFTAHAQDFMVDLGSDDLLREMCAEAAFVAAVSEYSAGILRDTCPDSADKIVRLYNGIEPETFPKKDHTAARGEAFRLISVGRLIEFKGFHHLIAACARLREDGVPAECTIIGEGPWREQLETQAKKLGIEDAVKLPGVLTQERVKAELAASDAFVLPCIVDAKGASDILPTVIMEAMAAELPVVSTTLVGVPEMVDHEKTGLLVSPGDEAALVEAIARLAKEPALGEGFGKAALGKVEKTFALDKTSAQLAGLFAQAMRDREHEATPAPAPAKVACLVDCWPAPEVPYLDSEVAFLCGEGRREEFAVFAAEAADPLKWKGNDAVTGALERVEFLPDGIVLEAEWKQNEKHVHYAEVLRTEFGSSVSGDEYFRMARMAVHLAAVVRKRGVRWIHATRSSMALCAWLIHELTGIPFSIAVEEEPSAKPRLLAEVCRDALAGSISCPKMSAQARKEYPDELKLKTPEKPKRFHIGPIEFGLKKRPEPEPDRTDIYAKWYDELARHADAAQFDG